MVFWSKSIQKSQKRIICGLVLTEEKGLAVIFSDKNQQQVDYIDSEPFDYSNSFDGIVEDIDKVLFSLEEKNNIKIDETIFFVATSWIIDDSDKIKSHYSGVIKKIIDNNQLTSLGYATLVDIDINDRGLIDQLTGILVEKYSNDQDQSASESAVDGFIIGKDIKLEPKQEAVDNDKPKKMILLTLISKLKSFRHQLAKQRLPAFRMDWR